MPYEKSSPSSPEAQSSSPIQDNLRALASLFPSVVRDGQVDIDALRQLCGEAVAKEDELFGLNWRGKSEARRAALTPSLGTLRPCREESKDWDTTQNLYIEGDNLEVLKLLRKSYGGRVKMIYIDPPYNTGNDFVYPDDYQNSIANYKKLTGQESKYAANVESSGRYHTTWLNMMYPRLILARDLLCEDGVIFISIDDNEVDNLKKICNEIFGEKCFIAALHVQMSTVQGQKVRAAKMGNIVKNAEYILLYSKNGNKAIGVRPLLDSVRYDNHYNLYMQEEERGVFIERSLVELIKENQIVIDELKTLGLVTSSNNVTSTNLSKYYDFSPKFRNFIHDNANRIVRAHDSIDIPNEVKDSYIVGKVYIYNNSSRQYYVAKNSKGDISQRILLQDKLGIADDFYRTYGPTTIRGDWWSGFYLDMGNVGKEGGVNYNNGKKPLRLLQQLITFCSKGKNDIILDFFSGSATTAHAVMKQNREQGYSRRFIMIQLPELCDEKTGYKNLCVIGIKRILNAGKEEKDEAGLEGQNLDIGFRVYKLDSSNVKAWNPQAEDLATAVNNYAEHLVGERTEEDFLTEIMLKSGIDLVEEVEERVIAGHRVQSLGFGQYYACMAADLAVDAEDVALGIAAWHEEDCTFAGGEQQDTCTVFVADRAFATHDAAKMNFVAILEQHGICNIKAL